MADLVINIPEHGFQNNDQVFVSWLDDIFYVYAKNVFAFKISETINGGDIVQFTSPVTTGFVRRLSRSPIDNFILIVTPPLLNSGAFKYPFGSGIVSAAITSVGTTATATIADTSTMVDGSVVTISGADQTEYNGDYEITIVNSTEFTYTFAGSGTSPATGTIKVNFGLSQTQLTILGELSQNLSVPGVAFSGYPFAGFFRSDVLRCVFRKITPAHVAILFE